MDRVPSSEVGNTEGGAGLVKEMIVQFELFWGEGCIFWVEMGRGSGRQKENMELMPKAGGWHQTRVKESG